jgi:hypothetical protein
MGRPTLRLFDGTANTSPELQDDVKQLQNDLNRFGFNLTVDGAFGRETEAAVHQFQLDHGLVSDGIVGPQTWAALEDTPAPDPTSTFPTTISSTNAAMTAQFKAALKFKAFIDAGAQIGLPGVVVAGIGSRESAWGLDLRPPDPSGTGDFAPRKFPTAFRTGPLPPDGGGYGRGLMQIDFDALPFARTGNWKDPQANINTGCMVLKSYLDLLGRKTSLAGRNLLQAAIAAYNCGPGNVLTAIREGHNVDFFTARRNYSADVLNRAGFFQNAGWESQAQAAVAPARS